MADPTFADLFPPNPNYSADYDPTSSDKFLSDLDFNFDDIDFTLDDLCLPDFPTFSNSLSPKFPAERSSDVASVSLNHTSPESETGSASSQGSDNAKNSVKRKKESGDVNSESRRRSQVEEEQRKKTRLMRNRESAQLFRQRKKHYVEELEEKVRSMHSTIQDMNTKISYIMAENASLRKQLSCVPIYPSMGYPWMMCPPPYASSRVPIPRLKSKKTSPAPNAKGNKTKKVASVSFLGLLFFILLFGGLVPIVNVKKFGGEMRDIVANRFYETQIVKMGLGSGNNFTSNIIIQCGRGHNGVEESNVVRPGNSSEPLVASLYVPRNDKLVKIDGNLIIHSVMASDKSMASPKDGASTETGLAVGGPAIPLTGRNNGRHQQHIYRSASADKDSLKSTAADGKLQQWFREGLAGPMLSSGMCTEVFQFDVSPAPAAIVPATSVMNVSAGQRATHFVKGRNRRILHGAPIPLLGSQNNITKEHVGRNPVKDIRGNNSLSSMVVSVLVDPRDAGDIDIDGKMRPKSLSRIFVVLLTDSVKYVTYSCMIPLKGSGVPLVTV